MIIKEYTGFLQEPTKKKATKKTKTPAGKKKTTEVKDIKDGSNETKKTED